MIEKKYLAELFGTGLFAFGINLSTRYTEGSQLPNLTSIICIFFSIITIIRNISGGHINGAVTLGVTVDEIIKNEKQSGPSYKEENSPYKVFVMYYVAQVAGCVIGCFFSWLIYHGHIFTFVSSKYSNIGVFVAETGCTFIFVYNILIQTSNRYTSNPSISTGLISVGLFTAVNMTSTLSSGCINSSLALGHLLAKIFLNFHLETVEVAQTLFYMGGEFLGGFLAAYCYNLYFKPTLIETENENATNIESARD